MWIEGASAHAAAHDFLMNVVHFVCILGFVPVNAALVYFIIKYRKRSDNDRTSKLEHSTFIEVAWTVVPTILMMVLFVMGLNLFREMRVIHKDGLQITAGAKQWAWEFQYPASVKTDKTKKSALKSYNVIYLEEGKPTTVLLKSKDVIHSFFIPAFRVKEDIVSNMFTYVSFVPLIAESQQKATRTDKELKELGIDRETVGTESFGVYQIFCTEYCGKDHSYMLGKAVVFKPATFQKQIAKLEESSGKVGPDEGRKIYEGNCKSCHSIDGNRGVGPTWKGLYGNPREIEGGKVTADENYITESILTPAAKVAKGFPNIMPPQDMSEEQITSVIEFMKTLK